MILTRTHADSDLRRWGLKLREKIGFRRAAVAVARKLSVIMHAILKSGELFNAQPCCLPDLRKGDPFPAFYPCLSHSVLHFGRAVTSLSGRGQDHSVQPAATAHLRQIAL